MFDFSGVSVETWKILLTVLAAVAILALIVVVYRFVSKRSIKRFETRDITYGAVCIAIAFALSFFGYELPQGGTITPASTVPIILYCYYFGFAKGSVVSAVYMILQLMQNPYIVTPWSAVLDYILPYLALSFTGIFSYSAKRYNSTVTAHKNVLGAHWPVYIGILIYCIVRYASHVLSGVIFWSEGQSNPLLYSLGYNSFFLVDLAIATVVITFLLLSRSFNTFMASKKAERSDGVVTSDRNAQ